MMRMFLRALWLAILATPICMAQASAPGAAPSQATPPAVDTKLADNKAPQKISDHSSGCHGLDGGELHKILANGYMLNIRPASDDMEALCWAEILDSSGHQAFGLNNFAVGLHDASGKDVDGDGKPDVILEATTGGHCCWTYVIISLNPFHKQAQITNERPLSFIDSKKGIVISGQDGVFDFFQGYSSSSPRADVFFRIAGSELHNANSEFLAEYDRQIAEARKKLTPQALEQFRSTGPKPDNAEVRAAILTVVLEFLYSGREEEAWKAFNSMWPESTREKTKKLILDTKARGVLTSVNGNVETVAASTNPQAASNGPNRHSDDAARVNAPPQTGEIEILSDTGGVDFSSYLAQAGKRIRGSWYELIPEVARPPVEKVGTVVVQFAILKDGKVAGITLVARSGDVSMDRACWGAIAASAPFPPFPSQFQGAYLALRLHFQYNPEKRSHEKEGK